MTKTEKAAIAAALRSVVDTYHPGEANSVAVCPELCSAAYRVGTALNLPPAEHDAWMSACGCETRPRT